MVGEEECEKLGGRFFPPYGDILTSKMYNSKKISTITDKMCYPIIAKNRKDMREMRGRYDEKMATVLSRK